MVYYYYYYYCYHHSWELVYTSDPSSQLFALPKLLRRFTSGFRQTVDVERKTVLYTTLFRIFSFLPPIKREQRAIVAATSSRKSAQTLQRPIYLLGDSLRIAGKALKERSQVDEKCIYLGRHVKVCELSSENTDGGKSSSSWW